MAWQPSSDQLQQFTHLQELLREWNSKVNLTRLVEGEDYWISQIFDSLWPLQPWLSKGRAAEGDRCGHRWRLPRTGDGHRAPQAQLTLVDSVGRKVQAVQAMADALGIAERVQLRCERAEKTGRDPHCRRQFQLAVARAVAAAPVVAEYLVPLLSADGTALLYRGQWSDDDQRQLQRAAALLNTTTETIQVQELPAQRGLRHVIPLRPKGACPKQYPRAVGVPAKLPLA